MTENLTKTNWKFLENRTWYAIMHVFMSFQANFTIESAKYIYIYQTFQIWNLQRAPRRSRARKLSLKKLTALILYFLCVIFWKSSILCMCTGPRAPLICALKSLINVDVFCTLNRKNISKIHEVSTKSFSAWNSEFSKILKKSQPRFFISKLISYNLFNLDEFDQFLSYDHVSRCK